MKNPLIKLWLIIGILSGFSAFVFFLLTYLNEKILCNLHCREKNEVELILILLSLFGLFVGSILYYFIAEKYKKQMCKINKDASATLDFLDDESKQILQALIKEKGSTTQAQLAKQTNISRVKVSRIVKKLAEKDIIAKNAQGMTNTISLSEKLQELFIYDK